MASVPAVLAQFGNGVVSADLGAEELSRKLRERTLHLSHYSYLPEYSHRYLVIEERKVELCWVTLDRDEKPGPCEI